jgi:hypothetical protein
MRETRSKTRTVAFKDHDRHGTVQTIKQHVFYKSGWGWLCPPEEGQGPCYIDGSYAYRTCVQRWKDHGWTVQREPNPLYREPDPLRGIFKF